MNIIHTLIVTVREQLQAASARRAQRLALNDLLSMNAARLDDLGLNRHDVVEAIAASRHSETDLDARRERNASRKLAFSVH